MNSEFKRFEEDAKKNPELVKAFAECKTVEDIAAKVNELGYDISKDEIIEQLHSGNEDDVKELTVDELDRAAGGNDYADLFSAETYTGLFGTTVCLSLRG